MADKLTEVAETTRFEKGGVFYVTTPTGREEWPDKHYCVYDHNGCLVVKEKNRDKFFKMYGPAGWESVSYDRL